MPKYSEGNIINEIARIQGSSYYLLLDEDMKEYLEYNPDTDLLVLKFDKGKHGKFIGVGIKKFGIEKGEKK